MIAPIPAPQTLAVAQRNQEVLLVVLRQAAALHQATAPGVDLPLQPLPILKLGRRRKVKEQWQQPTHRSHSTR